MHVVQMVICCVADWQSVECPKSFRVLGVAGGPQNTVWIGCVRRGRAADTTSDITGRGMPLHLAAVSVKSQPVAGRNDSVGFSAGLADFLSDGVTVAQRSLEPLVVVRIHVGQPLEDQRQTAGCIFVMLSFDSPRPLT